MGLKITPKALATSKIEGEVNPFTKSQQGEVKDNTEVGRLLRVINCVNGNIVLPDVTLPKFNKSSLFSVWTSFSNVYLFKVRNFIFLSSWTFACLRFFYVETTPFLKKPGWHLKNTRRLFTFDKQENKVNFHKAISSSESLDSMRLAYIKTVFSF